LIENNNRLQYLIKNEWDQKYDLKKWNFQNYLVKYTLLDRRQYFKCSGYKKR